MRIFLLLAILLSLRAHANELYEFVDLTSCADPALTVPAKDRVHFATFCKGGPKAWLDDEKKIISHALDQILAAPIGRRLIERVVAEKGTLRLYRGSRTEDIPTALAFAEVHSGAIFFLDRRFDPEKIKHDSAVAATVAHEIAHVFDCLPSNIRDYSCLSGQKSFAKAMDLKWFKVKDGGSTVIMMQPRGYKKKDYDSARAKARDLAQAGRKDEAREILRAYAHSIGAPTMYSLTGAGELLAEVIAFAIVDPQVAEYLSPDARAWVADELR